MEAIRIEGKKKTETKKSANKRLRKQNFVPCNIYGGAGGNTMFYAHENEFNKIVYTHKFQKAKVVIDGSEEWEAIIQDIQFHPVSDRLHHIDFLELVPDKKVITEVPLTFKGVPEGVKEGGGKMIVKRRSLKVKALPKNLVEEIEVNVEELGVGKAMQIADIAFSEIEILDSPEYAIAIVASPKAMEGAAIPEPGEEGETEEGEEGEETEEGEGGEGEESSEGGEGSGSEGGEEEKSE